MFDAIVIGAGISGASIARELARYKLKILVLEKASDICVGTSRGNSATVHSGHDTLPGSKKAYFNVLGNAMYEVLCQELSVPFMRNGTIVFATTEKDMETIYNLKERADANKVPDVQVLDRKGLIKIEAGFGNDVLGGLYAPTGGIVCPYTLVTHTCYNAAKNGVEFLLNTEVSHIKKVNGMWLINTNHGNFTVKYVFNCAGTHADIINNMVSSKSFKIIPRKGEHIVLDKRFANLVKATISQTPTDLPGGGHTKGMGMMPSVDGTLILGCPAYEVEDPDDSSTQENGLNQIINYFVQYWNCFPISKDIPQFPKKDIINCFGGVRAHLDTDDFIIGEVEDAPGFFNAVGIESPGLTAGPAIGRYLVTEAANKYGFEKNFNFYPHYICKKPFREMNDSERIEAIHENPDYGKLICRCEQVTLAEIKAAIHAPIGASSIDAVKMRTRAGMGRCQGGFCSPEVLRILADELGVTPLEITQRGEGSNVLVGRIGCSEKEE